jgi:hypothetical protein
MILGGILSENEKRFMKSIFKFDRFVVEHMKKHKRGLVDRRDHPNPINYIKSLVQNGNFTAIFVNSPERTVKLTRILGNDLYDHFRNGEVVFYNSTLKSFQRTKIEELISISKVKLFITTYEIGGMMQFPKNSNICLLDPPLTPLNIHSMSNPVEQKGAAPIFHLLYNRGKTKNYINSTFELLPLESDIISLIRIGCANGFKDIDRLKKTGIKNHLLSEKNWEIVLAVLSEIGMVRDEQIENKNYNELINRLKTSTVLLESIIDRMIIKDYSGYFINRSGRKVLSLIDYPVLPFIK